MKRLALIISLLLLSASLYPYQPNENEHIRFGVRGQTGMMLFRKGYALLYDTDKKQPLWVSYHIKREYLLNPLKPAFSFRPDPKLLSKQRAEMADFARGLYSRCRMANLEDMSRSREVMKECFYLSNVCPMNQQLYAGFWKQLEDATRKFVMRDNETWVITGPVFKAGNGKKSAVKKLGEGKIWVPTHFYKIIFYQGKDGSFNAISFLFENREQSGDIRSHAAAVLDIEKMTGLTFLDRLPDEVGKLVKGSKPSADKMDNFLGMGTEKN
jgi:endonuclease G